VARKTYVRGKHFFSILV